MAVNGVSNYSGYNYPSYSSQNEYDSWVEKAKAAASAVSASTSTSGVSSTDSKKTESASGVNTSSSSVFLMNYQMKLSDLESASSRLQTGKEDNVFSNYESALEKLSKAATDDEKAKAQTDVSKAMDEIVFASKSFAEEYNTTVSFLQSNAGRSSAVAGQLSSMQNALTTDKALQTFGFGMDEKGRLKVDEGSLRTKLSESYSFVKEEAGGQFGIAERVGSKATQILDSSVDSILGSSGSRSAAADSTNKKATGSNSSTGSLSSSAKNDSAPEGITSFYNFSRAGAYNLSNYYTVGMLFNALA